MSLAGILPPLLSSAEVAQLLHCTPRTVYNLTKAGRLPAPKRAGRKLLYDTRMIVEYITKDESGDDQAATFPP
jgi:excisionase family DNA binding protein